MKLRLPLFFLLLISVFVSCKESSVSTNNENNWPPGTIVLSETLPDWTYGTGYYLVLLVTPSAKYTRTVIDSSAIGSDGSFTIHLQPLEDKYYDDTVNFYNVYCFDSIIIQPPGLTQANTVFEIHKDGQIKGAVTGKEHKVGNDSTGSYYVSYRSYGSSSNIAGHTVCYAFYGTPEDTLYSSYNMSITRGWNHIISNIILKSSRKTIYSVSCTDPGLSTTWMYYVNKE